MQVHSAKKFKRKLEPEKIFQNRYYDGKHRQRINVYSEMVEATEDKADFLDGKINEDETILSQNDPENIHHYSKLHIKTRPYPIKSRRANPAVKPMFTVLLENPRM